MKINRVAGKKYIFIAVAAVVVLAFGLGVYAYTRPKRSNQPTAATSTSSPLAGPKVDLNPPTQQEVDAGTAQKKAVADQAAHPSETPSTLTVTITAANQNGSTLQIRTLINTISSSGSCKLHMTKDSQVYDATAAIQALASSSTCAGFDVPTSQLSPGVWSTSISVGTGSQQGSANKDITIN